MEAAFRAPECKEDNTSRLNIQVNVGRNVEVRGKITTVFYMVVSSQTVDVSDKRPAIIHYTYTPPVKSMCDSWRFEYQNRIIEVGRNGNIGSLCIDAYRTHIRIFCVGMAAQSRMAWDVFPAPKVKLAVSLFDRDREPDMRTIISDEISNGWDVSFLMGDINPPEQPQELYQEHLESKEESSDNEEDSKELYQAPLEPKKESFEDKDKSDSSSKTNEKKGGCPNRKRELPDRESEDDQETNSKKKRIE